MLVFDDKAIEEMSNGGLYDYITDLENEGALTPEEEIIIYQSALICIQDNLSPMRITEFLNDVNDGFKSLRNCKKAEKENPTLFLSEMFNANINGVIWEFWRNSTGWSIDTVDKTSISGNITIPADYKGKPVTVITEVAFSSCDKLESVSIPDSVTKIECYAFYGCTALTSVIIPNSVKIIENSAFENCVNLSSVTIPHTDITIEQDAFAGCPNLTFNTT